MSMMSGTELRSLHELRATLGGGWMWEMMTAVIAAALGLDPEPDIRDAAEDAELDGLDDIAAMLRRRARELAERRRTSAMFGHEPIPAVEAVAAVTGGLGVGGLYRPVWGADSGGV